MAHEVETGGWHLCNAREETAEATLEKLHGSTNLIVQAVVLRCFEEPREVDLKEEQVLSCCGMPSATLSQGHALTDPLTRQEVAYPQLKENRQF